MHVFNVLLCETRNHPLPVKVNSLFQILGATGVEDIASIVGQQIDKSSLCSFHPTIDTEADRVQQHPIGSVRLQRLC